MFALLNPFNIVIFGLWSISAILDYVEFCHIWQLKEYRIDRMRDFFSTKQGQSWWLNYFLLIRIFLVFLVYFWPINEIVHLKLGILAWFTVDVLYHVSRLLRRSLRYPNPTVKAVLLIISAFLFEFNLAILSRDWNVVFFFLIARFFVISFLVLVLNQITHRIKEWIIWRATKKIATYQKLIVIGITGSYGKSSVKEYLSQILAEKYRILKTPGNTNTDIGVAKFILRSDLDSVDMFVVEMGAYQIGEIKKICGIVKPKIGILTAIIEQHLSLFGSIENIQEAKYELLRAIPRDGLVITNADNIFCSELLPNLDCERKETFGEDIKNMPDCLISDIKTKAEFAVEWNIDYQEGTLSFSAPLLGAHQANNITPAIMVARYLGVSVNQITHAVSHLRPGEKALSVYQYGRATIIDDTYNSNPVGFKASLSILTSFPSTLPRIVITRGMLELGEKTREYHEQIGEEISFSADELIIITPDFVEDFMAGISALKDKYRLKDVKTIFSAVELLEYIKNRSHEPVIILLENRMPLNVYQEIKKNI